MLQNLTKSHNTLQPFLQRLFVVENGRARGSVARLIAAFSLTLCLTFAAPNVPSKAAVMHPWCHTFVGYQVGAVDCMYKTYQQCRTMSRSACVANPAMDPLPQATPDADSSTQASQPVTSRTAAKPGTIYLLENRGRGPGSSSHVRQRGQRR